MIIVIAGLYFKFSRNKILTIVGWPAVPMMKVQSKMLHSKDKKKPTEAQNIPTNVARGLS